MADQPSEWALREARGMVARWEHGAEDHRQWLRDMCVPEVARALDAARRQGREEMRERAACELDGIVVPASGKIGWGKVANVANAIRALPLDEAGDD